MQTAAPQPSAGQRDIQRFRRQLLLQRALLERVAPHLQSALDGLLDQIDARAGSRTLFGGQPAQTL
ncbi:MAG: hypothetical protein FD134_2690 [Gallionellaceae bacterium]|nr:MAG: hypothetical protein FD134_2690 [Gallionellaceae bacterium]